MKTYILAFLMLQFALTVSLRGDEIDKSALDAAEARIKSMSDPVFDQYANLAGLAEAWTYLDADAMADIGIGLAEGERILFRSHPAITSQEVLKVAIRTAGVTNKPEVLKKMAEYAEKAENQSLQEQIELASQLAGTTRSISPKLPLDEVTVGAFIAYKQAKLDLDSAIVFGSVERLEALRKQLERWKDKDPAIWTDLLKYVIEQAEAMKALGAPSRGGPGDVSDATASLNQLTAASRGWPPGGGYPGPGRAFPGFSGGNFGQNTQIDYYRQQQFQAQNPGALLIGGILGAVGQGVGQKDPQAGAILGGIGNSMQLFSQPTITEQGGININQQGFQNQWSGGFN